MMHIHNYRITELENMIPWERDVYIAQLVEYIHVENEKLKLKEIERQRSSNRPG
jgi:hypothetical protein